MSVRMAIVKLSAVVAGGALIGGGAVHMAEDKAAGKPQYVKHAKAPVHHVVKAPHRAKAKTVVHQPECMAPLNCEPKQALAVVPMPAPAVVQSEAYQDFGGPHGSEYHEEMGRTNVVVIDRNRHSHGHPVPGPTPVPAPPMLILFGMAAAALFGRSKLARKPA